MMLDLILRKTSVYSTVAYFYLQRYFWGNRIFRRRVTYSHGAAEMFEKVIREVPADKVFLHIALSSVRRFATDQNTYAYLTDFMKTNFCVITSQSFTPGVRKTKLFDPEKSLPAYGSFARQLFHDRTWRNEDPCYSVVASGDPGWPQNLLSFAPDGVFRQMIRENYWCINIGLEYVTCSLMHLVEYEQKVPYLDFFTDEFFIQKNEQKIGLDYPLHKNKRGYSVKGYVWWNKIRLMRDLRKAGFVRSHNPGGIPVFCFPMDELYAFVTEKVKKDPYYLIKW